MDVLPPADVAAAPRLDLSTADQNAIDALPAGTAMLIVHRGPGSGQRFLLDTEASTAGRDSGCDIFLDDVTVSRAHATFFRQGGRHVVRDTRSLNGTYVNGLRVHEAVLTAGDQVQIGKYHLVFHPSPHDTVTGP
jgi:pSer/pThr/pTyr-binding forkhead associated (FHA) protein